MTRVPEQPLTFWRYVPVATTTERRFIATCEALWFRVEIQKVRERENPCLSLCVCVCVNAYEQGYTFQQAPKIVSTEERQTVSHSASQQSHSFVLVLSIMIQCLLCRSLGTGKGGDSIWGDVPFEDEFHPDNKHDKRGMLAMANKGPNTNRCQFFFIYERQPHLNNVYTVFGRMLDGWEVLDAMERLPVMGGPKKSQVYKPMKPPVIEGVTIHANPLADEGIVYPHPAGPPERRM